MESKSDKTNITVAIFDSGIGGLNVLRACCAALSNAEFYYLSDNFNVPYGNKSSDEIFKLVKSKLDYAAFCGVNAAVIACNTATANCIGKLRSEYPFPIIGMQPAIKPAVKEGGKCLVLATPSTVNSPSFNELLSRFDKNNFIVHACGNLAEYIEQCAPNMEERVLAELLPQAKADSVVLGCTHYVFIADYIRKRYNCPIYDGIAGTVNHLLDILGIVDHFGGNSGMTDHNGVFKGKITYYGGNINKNMGLFNYLLHS